MSGLIELAERVEKATGSDRELDAAIGLAIGLATEDRTGQPGWHGAYFTVHLPAYTASLDAAMTLVPEGWLLITLSDIKADGLPWCVLGRPEDAATVEGIADHDKVHALAAAALRARAACEPSMREAR